jgi:predicted phage terminase large subunit-like protein
MSVLVIDAWQDHLQYPDLKPKVIDEYDIVFGEGRNLKKVDLVLVEDKAAGIVLIQDLQRAHVPVRAYNPGKADKIQRLSIVANIVRAGRVYIPESSVRAGYVRDWAEGMITQICSFPNATHDDFVDAFSQALRYMRDAGWLNIDPAPRDDYDPEDYIDALNDSPDYAGPRTNPYAA